MISAAINVAPEPEITAEHQTIYGQKNQFARTKSPYKVITKTTISINVRPSSTMSEQLWACPDILPGQFKNLISDIATWKK